jgi:Cof subfamily protein (haloacid dehalogenase superfamily)
MEKKLFITDFDRTLLKDDKTIAFKDIRTLEKLRQNNIATAVATGRSVYSFEKALKALGMLGGQNILPIDYLIFSTGAGIMQFFDKNVIWKKSIPSCDVSQISTYFDHREFDYMVHKSIPDTRQFLYKTHGHNNSDFQTRLELYNEFASPLEEGITLFKDATEVLAVIPGGASPDFIETIKNDLADFSVIPATSPLDHKSIWIEVFHKDVSKAKTASRLAKKLGIEQCNVISVGNDYNDQDLLAWSGKGFVVENAPENMKKKFETVFSNNDCGVTHAAQLAGLVT